MNKVVIKTNELGGVGVAYPTGEVSVEAIASMIGGIIVDETSLPEEHDFYDAWEQTNGVVTINLEKAKGITKLRLRRERDPLLAEQDVLYMKALEAGTSTTEIVAEKVRLRDITNLTDSCTTLDELRALKAAKE